MSDIKFDLELDYSGRGSWIAMRKHCHMETQEEAELWEPSERNDRYLLTFRELEVPGRPQVS